jgi:GTP cyclohydrolase I
MKIFEQRNMPRTNCVADVVYELLELQSVAVVVESRHSFMA